MFLLLISQQCGQLLLSLNLMAVEGSCQVLAGWVGGVEAPRIFMNPLRMS